MKKIDHSSLILRKNFENSDRSMYASECDVPVPGIPGTGNFHFFGGIGTGIGKIWYRKKSTGIGIGKIWYRKEVSELVLEKN